MGRDSADRPLLASSPRLIEKEPGGGIRQLCRQVRPANADGNASGLLQALGGGGMRAEDEECEQATEGFVTVVTGAQLFGLRLERVRDVFVPRGISRVPLAPPEVAGLLNLRGRIVTAIDLRRRLGLPPREDGGSPVAVGIEERGELYGLIVDRVGDVLRSQALQLRGQSGQSRSALDQGLRRCASARARSDGRARCGQGARSQWTRRCLIAVA